MALQPSTSFTNGGFYTDTISDVELNVFSWTNALLAFGTVNVQ